ncbi:MAG: tRNA pseudouridine(38-40) synthase TruA [Olegusella sp.]|nr:tRNA pseudouridine(38-40) synthase TruA [Olegusella sp.]
MAEDMKSEFEAAGTMVVELGYRGADFAGYAEQPGQRTVAGEMRRALETVLRRPVEMDCAGRTDAGVHALAQYVSLPVTADELALSQRRLMASLVALTPDDISIRAVYQAPVGFSARFDAVCRHYRYRVSCGPTRPVMGWDHTWWLRTVPELDVAAMNEAATALLGEHDFRSFCKASSAELLLADGRSTSRYLSVAKVNEVTEAGEDLLAFDVAGNAFLHNMVRAIVGTLVEVGRGHRPVGWVADVLAACDRSAAGPTAPATGLTLDRVDYPADSLTTWS